MKRILLVLGLLSSLSSCDRKCGDGINMIISEGTDIDWPKDTCAHAGNVKRWMSEVINTHFGVTDDTVFCTLKDYEHFFHDQCETELAEYKEDLTPSPQDKYYFTDSLKIKIVYNNKSVVTYKVTEYQSLGNTHPWKVHSFASFDKRTGKRIVFGDMFPENSRKRIIHKILSEVDRQKGETVPKEYRVHAYVKEEDLDYSSYDGNGFPLAWGFHFNNPGIIAQGFVFYFLPYQLGSYAEGEFEVIIPKEYSNIHHELFWSQD